VSESTFVLISRKRCTRAQQALSVATIELSRALGALIIHRRERSRTPLTLSQLRACFAHEASAQRRTQVRLILHLPIYSRHLRGSRLFVQKQSIARTEPRQARETMREATPFLATSVSNRNGEHAHRNRIFLRRRYQISVDETL
jgi:hypothetical protein